MEKKDEMHNVSPVSRKVWLCLREFASRKSREENRVITMGEIVEKAIMEYIEYKK